MGGGKKKFMFVHRKAPYGTIYALESLEVLLIAGAFDQHVSAVFLDDGVFQLMSQQDTAASGMKNFSPTFRALADFGVEKLYVERESLELRGIDENDLLLPTTILDRSAVGALMESQDVLFNF